MISTSYSSAMLRSFSNPIPLAEANPATILKSSRR